MKKLKVQVNTVSKSLAKLSKQVDKITKQLDKLKAPKAAPAKRKRLLQKKQWRRRKLP